MLDCLPMIGQSPICQGKVMARSDGSVVNASGAVAPLIEGSPSRPVPALSRPEMNRSRLCDPDRRCVALRVVIRGPFPRGLERRRGLLARPTLSFKVDNRPTNGPGMLHSSVDTGMTSFRARRSTQIVGHPTGDSNERS